jgi:hypothetical protein
MIHSPQEEGGYEYVSDSQSTKPASEGEEHHIEPAILVQSLEEDANAGSSARESPGTPEPILGGCPSTHDPCWKQVVEGNKKHRTPGFTRAAEKCVAGAGGYGVIGKFVDAVDLTPEGAAATCAWGILFGYNYDRSCRRSSTTPGHAGMGSGLFSLWGLAGTFRRLRSGRCFTSGYGFHWLCRSARRGTCGYIQKARVAHCAFPAAGQSQGSASFYLRNRHVGCGCIFFYRATDKGCRWRLVLLVAHSSASTRVATCRDADGPKCAKNKIGINGEVALAHSGAVDMVPSRLADTGSSLAMCASRFDAIEFDW